MFILNEFVKYIWQCNHPAKQDMKHFHHLKSFCASYSQFPLSKKPLFLDLFHSAECSLLVIAHDMIVKQALYPLSVAQVGGIFIQLYQKLITLSERTPK